MTPSCEGCHTDGACWATQLGSVRIDAGIWIASCVVAILGLMKAAYSTEPLLWIAVWPAPVVLVSTIFIFLRQGFHFRNGVLVLGRRARLMIGRARLSPSRIEGAAASVVANR